MKHIFVSVSGGVAEVASSVPKGISVEIIDYDNLRDGPEDWSKLSVAAIKFVRRREPELERKMLYTIGYQVVAHGYDPDVMSLCEYVRRKLKIKLTVVQGLALMKVVKELERTRPSRD
jgi:hypothetical protein